jgi:hypothetical protein
LNNSPNTLPHCTSVYHRVAPHLVVRLSFSILFPRTRVSSPQWSPPHLLQASILLLLLPTTNMVTLAGTALRRVIPPFPFRPFLLPLNLAYWPSSSNHFGKTTNVSGPSKLLHVVCVGISRVHRPAIANRYIDICNRPVQHWTISSRTICYRALLAACRSAVGV